MSFDFQPTLVAEQILIRPLQADDYAPLFDVASDPELWAQHPSSDRYKPEVFSAFFETAMQSGSAFVIVDRETSQIIGSSRYNGLDVSASEVEIGWTFIARSHWGSATNRIVKKLMLEHAFRFVHTVIFWIGENNFRSRRAVEKLGATLRVGTVMRGGTAHVVYALERSQFTY